MRLKLLVGLCVLALAPAVMADPSPIWQNPGFYDATAAPQIDALAFWNPSGATFVFGSGIDDYKTADTLSYTNQGVINCDPGFDFETFPTTFGQVGMAANFVNEASGNNGVINCTSGIFGTSVFTLIGNFFFARLSGSANCIVAATNIINSGTVSMDASSLMKFTGENVDMTRGTLAMANLSTTNFGVLTNTIFQVLFGFGQSGWLDGYWGAGNAVAMLPPVLPHIQALPAYPSGVATLLNPLSAAAGLTDDYEIATRNQVEGLYFLPLQFPTAYVEDSGVVGSNRWVEAVLLQDNNPAYVNTVYFPGANSFGGTNPPFEIAVQWQWTATNYPSGAIQTNYIYVTDNFGEVTNIGIAVHGEINRQAPFPEFTYMPENYNIVLGVPFTDFFGTSPAAPSPITGNALGIELGGLAGPYTNDYSAYEAIFTAANQLTTDVAGGNVTNLSGRIEITAKNTLDLTGARITPLNYLLLSSTNHFKGAIHAQIASPNSDFYLRTTNGLLLFTNLVQPYLPNAQGPCELWSARYTNVENNVAVPPGSTNLITVTNSYHILFVATEFSPVTPTAVETLNLTVTNFAGARNNLFISDVVNVTSNLLLTTDALIVTTNGPGSPTPEGQLNIFNPNTLWPTALPNLQYLTNYGQISNANSVFFGGSHTQPPYNPSLVNIPYQAFVNQGVVLDQGSQIWSLYFQNGDTNAGGTFQAGNGSIILQQCFSAVLMNGAFFAGGDVTIDSASLLVSNHVIISGGALTLSNSYYLDDGSYATASALNVTNKNFWSVESGINLPVLPTYASLLGTTITNIDLSNEAIPNIWAGVDRGQSPDGFSDNAALGHLILDGRDPASEFDFNLPPGSGNNAIYVDLLELNNFAGVTNAFDPQGNALSVRIMPGMKIYFGRALANGVEFSEHLNGRFGVGRFDAPPDVADSGQFFWVTNYTCGFFSSTNIDYPGGVTNMVNAGLYADCVAGDPGVVECSGGLPTIFNVCAPTPPVYISATPPVAPVITISSGAEGTTNTAPAVIPLAANIITNGHTVSKVLFYDGANFGATLLSSNTAAPYTCTWTNVAAGTYTPTAVLVYDQGSAVVAVPVSITVKGAKDTNVPPSNPGSVVLTPPPADTNVSGAFNFTKGSYHGLFYDTNAGVNASSAGSFTATTTPGGGVSAKIAVGGHTYSFSGKFDSQGMATGAVHSGSARLNVQLQLTSDNQQIQGTISQGNSWSAVLQADLQAASAAGTYTMVIPPSADGPQGYGIGTVTVDAAGNLKWSGTLADGTKVTQSSAVSAQGFWPLYAPLYSGSGFVMSWMQFITGGVNGDLIWLKPAGGSSKYYPGGFTNDVEATGSTYSKPARGTPVLNWPSGLGNAIFESGGLSAPITNQISLSANNKVKDLTGTYKLALSITTSSGLFNGSVTSSSGHRHVSFSGAIWSSTNAAGFFLNPSEGLSGSVLLEP